MDKEIMKPKNQMPTIEDYDAVIKANKAWREQADKDCQSYIHGICDTYRMWREAFKKSLAKMIEERIKSLEDQVNENTAFVISERVSELEYLLDNVYKVMP